MTVSRDSARYWLLGIWLVGLFVPALILILQTAFGKYGDKYNEAWSWFSPLVFPTLSLMIGVVVARANGQVKNQDPVPAALFWIAVFLSVSYLVLVSATIGLANFASVTPLTWMKMSSAWLGLFQGLVSGVLGAFFMKAEAA